MKRTNKNFDNRFPLWLACGLKDKIRTGLHNIMFANGYAYATNSYILVKARLTDISDFDEQDLALLDGKFINGNNFKKIVKSKGIVNITEDAIEVIETDYSVRYPLLEGIKFPDCERVLTSTDEVSLQPEFGLAAHNLDLLSDVMDCCAGVRMEWRSNNKFIVRPIGGAKDIRGMIMTNMIY